MESTQLKKDAVELTSHLSPSAGIIVAIAIVGFAVLFSTLTAVGILIARRRNREAEKRMLEVERGQVAILETKQTPLPPPPDPSFSRYVYNPFIPNHDGHTWNEWNSTTSSRNKLKQLVNNKQKFRAPTANNKPSLLVPTPHSIKVNNFNVPEYETDVDPKWPKRTLSRRTTVSTPRGNSPRKKVAFGDPYSSGRREYKKGRHLRSVSETQLSTILRSTSERLKAANRRSLTRTTNLAQVPGAPPTQPLPKVPEEKLGESAEQLLESDPVESVASSIYDLLQNTESPVKSSHRKPPRVPARMDRSPAPSEDSLRVSIVPPTALSSPSRSKPKLRQSDGSIIPFAETMELAETVDGKNQAPVWETVNPLDLKRPLSMPATYLPSPAHDPFSSETNKSLSLRVELLGTRPLYIRKSNLTEDKLPRRPQSCMAPLQHTSTNIQRLPKPLSSIQNSNPFQWSTQDIVHSRCKTPTSPTRKRNSKRSIVIRFPNLSQSTNVGTVQEVQDVSSPIDTIRVNTSNIPVLKSKPDSRPPSIATFNPTLNHVKRGLSVNSTNNSQEISRPCTPVFGEKRTTLNPENQLFARGLRQISPKRKQHISTMLSDNLLPSTNSQGQLISFPPPNISPTHPQPKTTRPTLPRISTIYSPPPKSIFMQHSQAQNPSSPLPPLLTIAGHLTGPRPELAKAKPALRSAFRGSFFSTPTPALKSSMALLKRMDSAITLSSVTESPIIHSSFTQFSIAQSSNTQQMDLNFRAVRAETQATKARGRDASSLLQSSPSQKRDEAPAKMGRGAGIHMYERRDGKRLRSGNVGNQDMDFFLRQRGLASPTFKETKKLSLVKEVDLFHPQVKKQSFGSQAPESREGEIGTMGEGTTIAKSGFNLQFFAVDPSTFSISSSSEDSDVEYEPESEPQLLAPKAPKASKLSTTHITSPAKSSNESLPQNINTAPQHQEQEEEDRLAKYAYSPASTPPPSTFKFIQIDPTPTTPTQPVLPLSAVIPSELPQNRSQPQDQNQTQTQLRLSRDAAANSSTITRSAPPPHRSSTAASVLSLKSPNTSLKSRNSTTSPSVNHPTSLKHTSSIYSLNPTRPASTSTRISNCNPNSLTTPTFREIPVLTTPFIFPPARSHQRDSSKFTVTSDARGRVRSFGIGVQAKSNAEAANANGRNSKKWVPEWVWSLDGLGLGLGAGVSGLGVVSGADDVGGERDEWDANCGGGSEVMREKGRGRGRGRSMDVYVDGENINTGKPNGEGAFF